MPDYTLARDVDRLLAAPDVRAVKVTPASRSCGPQDGPVLTVREWFAVVRLAATHGIELPQTNGVLTRQQASRLGVVLRDVAGEERDAIKRLLGVISQGQGLMVTPTGEAPATPRQGTRRPPRRDGAAVVLRPSRDPQAQGVTIDAGLWASIISLACEAGYAVQNEDVLPAVDAGLLAAALRRNLHRFGGTRQQLEQVGQVIALAAAGGITITRWSRR